MSSVAAEATIEDIPLTTTLVLLHVGLVLVTFLTVLNGYLRGRSKARIDAVLGLTWIVSLVIVLVKFGWKASILALTLSFVYAAIGKPIAAQAARRLLGYRTAIEGTSLREPDSSVDGMLRRADDRDQRLNRIAKRPEVARLLAAESMTAEDLQEHFSFLIRLGMGEMSWDVVSNPEDLRCLIELRRKGISPMEIAAKLMR